MIKCIATMLLSLVTSGNVCKLTSGGKLGHVCLKDVLPERCEAKSVC